MKRTALLVFVGVTIGVTGVVGIVWLHEVGWRQLFGDRNEVAKKPGAVILEAGSVIRSTPAVTFVQNQPRTEAKVLADKLDRGDAFDDSPDVPKVGPPNAVRTPPTRSDDPFGIPNSLQDSMTVSQTKTPKTVGDDAVDAEPKLSAGGFTVEAAQSAFRRVVPKTRTVTEYVQTTGPDGTTRAVPVQRNFTVYEEEVISPEEQVEIAAFRKAVEALKSAKEEAARTKATEELRALMHKYFQRDMQRREKDLLEAEGRVKKLREQFDKRKAAEMEIVNLRLQMMINEATGLGFSLPFEEGNASSAVPYQQVPQPGYAAPIYTPVAPSMSDGPGPGIAPPPIRRNRGKDDGATFEPRRDSPSGPAPVWNSNAIPKQDSDGSFKPLPKPSVSEPDTSRVPLNSSALEPENIEGKPSLAPSENPRESESVPVAETPELEAIEAETNRAANELPSDKPLSPEQIEMRRSSARTDVLIKNLTFPVEARSIVAARELGRLGKEAAAAVPELERLIKMERDEKGFPSDKQREAFLEALEKIKSPEHAQNSSDAESSLPGVTPELAAIEAEVNRSFEELRKKRDTPVELRVETEFEADNQLRTEARLGVLIKNLTSPNEARSIVAAKELGRIGKEATGAIPELEKLVKKERDEKGFPSDKQREAFLEAFVKIHSAIKAKDAENPKSIEEPGAA